MKLFGKKCKKTWLGLNQTLASTKSAFGSHFAKKLQKEKKNRGPVEPNQ